ncbi:hypothetical protein D3C71_1943880 [compost metagenome]
MTTTLLPGSSPISAPITSPTSRQKSTSLVVTTWLALTVEDVLLPPESLPLLLLPLSALSEVVTWPELTRVSVSPRRCRLR